MGSRHSVRATRALRKLSEVDPAFAALSLWCRHRDAAGADPAWTDGRTIFYGELFESFSLDEQIGLCAHQILHVAFRHVPRARSMFLRFGDAYDDEIYNLATDAIVNEALFLSGYILPRPCVTLSGLLRSALHEDLPPERAIASVDADALYVRLMLATPRGGRPGDEAAGRRGAGQGKGMRGEDTPAEAARVYARKQGFRPDMETAGADPDSNGPEEEGEWRQRLARALAQGRIAGAGIGALGHRIADIPEPRTPWEVVLRGLLARAVQQHPRRSHARPTRRWIALDDLARAQGRPEPAYEPGILHRTDVPKIAVGLDSSSSIDGPRLALFAAQVAGIGRRTGAEVHVLVFDTQVRRHEIMHGGDWESRILDIAFSREGGTAFGDVLEQAANLRPSAIVILTDLEAPVGPAPGRMPVIWAVPEPPSAAPPFGRVLSLER